METCSVKCQCQGIEKEFNQKVAKSDLKGYLTKGPAGTTQMLIEALKAEGVQGLTLLDIGGGVGVIQYELLKAGVSQATSVEASQAYLDTAEKEASRRGLADRVNHHYGDFVAIARDIPGADIVTLNRVICCYDDMQSLVDLSSRRARKYYAVIYPRDTWWMGAFRAVSNFIFRLRKNPFRIYIHPTREVEAIIRKNGLDSLFQRDTFVWQIKIFARITA